VTPAVERVLVRLPDGRDLDTLIGRGANPEGLLFIAGAPTGAVPYPAAVRLAASRGLRYVGWARPGYSRSTRQPDRMVADFAADLEAVAGHFGLRRLYVIGWSSGGPPALAAAALSPELVQAVATIGAVAPNRKDGVNFETEIGPEKLAEQLEGAELAATIAQHAQTFPTTPNAIRAALQDLPPSDRAMAEDAEYCDFMAETHREAVSSGIWGWHDDVRSEAREWDFDLGSIRVPVSVWHGLDDLLVAVAHGRWLADNVPGVRAHILQDEGHLSIAANRLDEVLDELVGAGSADPAPRARGRNRKAQARIGQ
jgi:pimeloyl-ACP methyl ester carboxylesterase